MFPIRDTIPSRRPPVVTWAIILANVVVFAWQLAMPDKALEQTFYLYGVVPKRFINPWWADSAGFPGFTPVPFLTSMFLHGGWFHIIVNMWTLWIFGDNVEDRMGHFRFLVFYLICGLISGIAHMATNPLSEIPAIGASGAIAGVLAAYFILYPFAWVLCVIPIFFYPLFVQIPAAVYGIFWFVSQLLSGAIALTSPGQAGGIAWWAHIGGFVAGAGLHRKFIGNRPPPLPARFPGRR